MRKIILLDPFGCRRTLFGHRHFLRDWTGGWIPGFTPFPPLDLMYTAAYLRKYGYEVQIIEASVKHWSHEKIVQIIEKNSPDFIFLPSALFSLDDDKHLSRLIRKSIPKAKIVFAGPLVTYDPSLVLLDDSADFVALGEYESPLLSIMKGDYEYNVAYRNGSKIICNQRRLLDLNELPIPARDLVDNQAYRYAIFNRRNPVTAMTISRGCPHSKCEFCHSKLYTLGEIRYRNIDSIIEELNEIVFKYKIGEVFFRDQSFTADRSLVSKICEYIISNNIDILWRAATRVDLVDKELLTLMHRAGCYQIAFGFESNSQRSLDINNKGITIEQSRQAARWAKEVGMEIVGLFICGMLGDNNESMKKLFKFVLELDINYANFKEFFVVPGSPFFEKFNMEEKSEVFSNELAKLYTMLSYLKFYLRPKCLLKQITKIKSWDNFTFLIKVGLNELFFHF